MANATPTTDDTYDFDQLANDSEKDRSAEVKKAIGSMYAKFRIVFSGKSPLDPDRQELFANQLDAVFKRVITGEQQLSLDDSDDAATPAPKPQPAVPSTPTGTSAEQQRIKVLEDLFQTFADELQLTIPMKGGAYDLDRLKKEVPTKVKELKEAAWKDGVDSVPGDDTKISKDEADKIKDEAVKDNTKAVSSQIVTELKKIQSVRDNDQTGFHAGRLTARGHHVIEDKYWARYKSAEDTLIQRLENQAK